MVVDCPQVSRSGSELTTAAPFFGDITGGAEIPTPAIGPATLGLVGVSLLVASQAAVIDATIRSADSFVIDRTFFVMAVSQ